MDCLTVCEENPDIYDDDYTVKRQQLRTMHNTLYLIFILMIMVWAITLALRVPDAERRILHLIASVVVAPLYVISYYVSRME